MSTRGKLAGLAFVGIAATMACAQILGLEPPPSGDASVTFDATAPDVVVETCAPLEADDASYRPLTNGPLDDAGNPTDGAAASTVWESLDLDNVASGVGNFAGGVFDGSRYAYFVPNGSGNDAIVMQYDTAKPFTSKSSWASFNTRTNLGVGREGFLGAAFDERYVYFVPNHYVGPDGGTAYDGVVVRYDTTMPFGAVGSWSTFDTQTIPVDGGAYGFAGSVFDGRNVYFVPYTTGVGFDGRAARYDTEFDGGFPDAGADAAAPGFAPLAAWSAYDLGAQQGTALGFYGGAFDGRYVYFAPYANGNSNNTFSGTVARYDTAASFTTSGAWSFNEIDSFLPGAYGFVGAAFDGQYVYFVPHQTGIAVRYDTTQPFGEKPSWSTFDVGSIIPLDGGAVPVFSGGAFDGRFVYFIPSTTSAGGALGVIVRYDTLSAFDSLCAWSTFDTTTVNGNVIGFFGAVYDGRFLYLPPRGSIAVRYDTKAHAAMPALPAFHGSFF